MSNDDPLRQKRTLAAIALGESLAAALRAAESETALDALIRGVALLAPKEGERQYSGNTAPDWTHIWTPEKAERFLSFVGDEERPFRFLGVGWYFSKDFTLLVTPSSDPKAFQCHFWNNDPSAAFNWVINAPIRADER